MDEKKKETSAFITSKDTLDGPNTLEVPGQQKIELRMNQWEFSIGYAWKF